MSAFKPVKASLAAALSAAVAFTPTYSVAQTELTDVSDLRITQGGSGARSASLVLPLGKSAVIDLPSDARDVLLSNPNVADAVVRTARRVYVIGRTLGQTNAFFFDANGRQIANVEIRVEPDVAPLNELLTRHSSDSRVRAEALNGSLVLSGTARSAAEADRAVQLADRFISSSTQGQTSGGPSRIVNLIQVEGSEQVLVRVRVVEMSRTLVRQLGINLNYEELINQMLSEDAFVDIATQNGFSISGRLLGGLRAGGGVAESILQPRGLTYPGSVGGTTTPGAGGVAGYSETPLYDPGGNFIGTSVTQGAAEVRTDRRTDASIEAFERAGLLRILAEPNLTAISGEAARFLAGGEFPVPVQSDENGQI